MERFLRYFFAVWQPFELGIKQWRGGVWGLSVDTVHQIRSRVLNILGGLPCGEATVLSRHSIIKRPLVTHQQACGEECVGGLGGLGLGMAVASALACALFKSTFWGFY